jgi:hypothetical protein
MNEPINNKTNNQKSKTGKEKNKPEAREGERRR